MTVPEDLKNQLEELGIDVSEAILAYLRGLIEKGKRLRTLKSIEEHVGSLVNSEIPAGTIEELLREDGEHAH